MAFLFVLFLLCLGQRSRASTLELGAYTGDSVTIQLAPSVLINETPAFSTGTLNGQSLNLFCVDLSDAILPGSYDSTSANNNGILFPNTTYSYTPTNAGGIAWLIDTFANHTKPNSDQRLGLQAAIWDLEYGYSLVAPGADSVTPWATYKAYNFFLRAYAKASSPSETFPTSTVYWITPNDSGNPGDYQALAGNLTPAPEPKSLILFVLGIVGLIPLAVFRRKMA
jgi:hypothetical protein